MVGLTVLTDSLEPIARSIQTLEGKSVSCADVFSVWTGIAWHLEQRTKNSNSCLFPYRLALMKAYNHRFDIMMASCSHSLHLFTYFLHPDYRSDDGLKLHMPAREALMSDANKETLKSISWSPTFRCLLHSALNILKTEQTRPGRPVLRKADGSPMNKSMEADAMFRQIIDYAYRLSPFSHTFDNTAHPTVWWQRVAEDDGARPLAVSSVSSSVFSNSLIMR